MERVHCFKLIVEDHVKLQRYFSSDDVEDEGYLQGVQVGETKKHTKASARGPLRYLLPILQGYIKDIYWTTKDMSMCEYIVL